MKSNKKLYTIIILIIGLISAFYVWRAITFRVTGVFPGKKTVSIDTPYIEVSFNKALHPNNATTSITASPNIIKSVHFSDKSVRINLKDLSEDQQYVLRLESIQSAQGKLVSKTITFKAKTIAFNKLSKKEQAVAVEAQDQSRDVTDPILASLPYGGLHFYLTSEQTNASKKTKLELHAQILLAKSDLDDTTTATNAYKQEVADYITSLGLKVEDYTITYEIIEPSTYY